MFDQDEPYPVFSKGIFVWVTAGVLGLVLVGYAVHEHHVSQNLNAQNSQLQASLKAQDSQLNQLTAAVNQLTAQQQQEQAQQAAAAAAKPSPVIVHHIAVHHNGVPDSRYKKLQSQLDAQGKEIEDTRNDLASTRTELSSGIAKNHDELVVLERKGERNYFEFDLYKSKQFSQHGEVGIRLRKANDKHQYADLDLMVDDRNLTQKHVNLYQPVQFYTPDSPQPVELVINNVSKNHIHGYVSTSKYSKSELAAMSNANSQSTTADADNNNPDAQSPPARQKLTVPQ